MISESEGGWWWHVNVFNYITGVTKACNSPRPFHTHLEALKDLVRYIEETYEQATKEDSQADVSRP